MIKKIDENVFVVQINDASWIDFSNTLTLSVL